MLKLFFITNRVEVAELAQKAGVDRVFIDLETIGKVERQKGKNTVISNHALEDIDAIKAILDTSKLLVRVDPVHDGSKQQINEVIKRGADIVMLPMYKSTDDVKRFIDWVGGRAKTMLLLENASAYARLEPTLEIPGIDEIHIGLNDLYLSMQLDFMFETLAYGIVEHIATTISKKGIPFGFGGIARIGYGMLPAEYIIAEHYRLKSTMAILSRSFCDANKLSVEEVEESFFMGMRKIRECEKRVASFTQTEFECNHRTVIEMVNTIVKEIEANK